LGAFLLFFLRFGYDYANSDQDEVIPYLLHRLDPGLFTQDWFVNIQMSEFSVRTYFVWLLNSFSLIFPVWLTTLVLYVVVWVAIAAAVYKLAFHVTRDQLAASASVVVALVLTPMWTLGGNDLVHSMLVASMVSWALGLWATYHFLRGRYLIAPVLLGVACWMQALVALHIALLLTAVRLYRVIRREPGPHTIGGVFVFAGLFVLWASPSLGPLVFQQLTTAQEAFSSEPSLFYILAEFRLPHHYMPGSFYLHSYVRFGLLAAAAGGVLLSARYRRGVEDLSFILRSLVVIGLLCLVAAVFTEIFPVLLVAKLQLFKMTVFAKLFFVILLTGAVCYWIPESIRAISHEIMRRPGIGLVVVVIAWIGVGSAAVLTEGYFHDSVGPFRRANQPVGQVEAWTRRNTSSSAIFAVPPSFSSFRSEAHRTIVINHKAIPYDDRLMETWFRRLMDMAPIELPERGTPETIARLDSAFANLSADELRILSDTYRFEYVVRPAPLAATVDATAALESPADAAENGELSDADERQFDVEAQADGEVQADAGVAADSSPSTDTLAATAAQTAPPRRFSEVFRAGDLYVYRLITPAPEPDAAE
jgi:hypothetical protein